MLTMTHYAQKQPDGTVHVTNFVGAFQGQHHVHTTEEFETWEPAGKVEWIEGCEPCDCGKKAGTL